MEKQKVPPAAYISFYVLLFATVMTGLFFAGDAFDGHYHDGWRYFLPLVSFDLLFTIAAMLYLFRSRWLQVGYTVLLAIPLNCIGSFRQLAMAGFITCGILLVVIIAFRKKLIQ